MTCIYFLCGTLSVYVYYLSPNDLPSLPRLPPRVPARSYGQAGGPREAAGGGGRERRGERRPAGRKRRGSGRYRQPRLSVTNCAELARKFPEFEAERR